MKRFLIILIALLYSAVFYGQNTAGKTDDTGRIALKAYVPSDIGDLTPTAQKMLTDRLQRIVTSNGIGGTSFDNRFILTAKITELSKDVSATTPIIYSYTLEITLLVGDAVSGTLFSSTTIEQKGAGNSETKAYIQAINSIKPKSKNYQEFLDEAKTKIVEYYNSKCNFIIKEAQTLTAQNEFEEAIFRLTAVPEVCKDCYDKCMDAVAPIYQKQIDRDCKIKLSEATNAWNANQNDNGANMASDYLSYIDPNASCYKEAQMLSSNISKKILEIEKREWSFKMKQQQDNVDVTKARIKAARDIGVAYGNGQPKTIQYNVRGWW